MIASCSARASENSMKLNDITTGQTARERIGSGARAIPNVSSGREASTMTEVAASGT